MKRLFLILSILCMLGLSAEAEEFRILTDKDSYAEENFVSEYDGAFYARLYKSRGL